MQQPDPQPLDLIWGTKTIAAVIGRTVRQTEGLLYSNELPAKKLNGRWVASRRKLLAYFEERAA